MEQTIEDYVNEIINFKFKEKDLFIQREGENYYEIEDEYIFPKIVNSKVFQNFIETLKTYKNPMTGLRNLTKDFRAHFHLDNIKFKTTKNKEGDSYFHHNKKTVFMNKSLIEEIHETKDDCAYDILTITFLHELVHAYTIMFYDHDSSHNNVFFVNAIKLFSFFIEEEEDYFYNIQLEYANGSICKPVKSILNEQLFLTGNKDYINEKNISNEKELKKIIRQMSEKIKNGYFKDYSFGKWFSIKQSSEGQISYYRVVDEYGLDLMSIAIKAKSFGFTVFEFDRCGLIIDEIKQIEIFRKNNKTIPPHITENVYKKGL